MSMEYIRRVYGVPAKRGGKIKLDGRPGIIKSARGALLRVQFENERLLCHPTWMMVYETPSNPVVQATGVTAAQNSDGQARA